MTGYKINLLIHSRAVSDASKKRTLPLGYEQRPEDGVIIPVIKTDLLTGWFSSSYNHLEMSQASMQQQTVGFRPSAKTGMAVWKKQVMSCILVFRHRGFSGAHIYLTAALAAGPPFAGLDAVQLPEVLCQWPGFDLLTLRDRASSL